VTCRTASSTEPRDEPVPPPSRHSDAAHPLVGSHASAPEPT
jgi:hypothetical protein